MCLTLQLSLALLFLRVSLSSLGELWPCTSIPVLQGVQEVSSYLVFMHLLVLLGKIQRPSFYKY